MKAWVRICEEKKMSDFLNNLELIEFIYSIATLIQRFEIQWGYEIQTSLDFIRSKRGWFANGQDFEWDLKSQSPTI